MPVLPPRGEEIYREEIPITPMKFLAGFEVLLGLFFLAMALIQQFSGPVVSNPPPTIFWLFMAAVFLGPAWWISNFITYRLTMEADTVNLSFGRFRTIIRYEDIEEFERDTRSGWDFGWGYRFILTRDGWVKAYIMVGKYKIKLKLKSGRYRHIIFSTDHPQEVMDIIRERLKNATGHVRSAF